MTSRPFHSVDADDLAHCVSCGLCLPSCPTYRITGLDSHSPRGRIALVDAVRQGRLDLDSGVHDALSSCVQCMGCVPACPSGVRYDRIIKPVIDDLTATQRVGGWLRRILFTPLGRPRLLSALTRLAFVMQRFGLLPRRVSAPKLAVRRRRLPKSTGSGRNGTVELLTGCVMGEWFGDVHSATIEVLVAMGFKVKPTSPRLCCGALHSHSGLQRRATKLLDNLKARPDQSAVLVTNSAGCGAHLVTEGVDAVDIMDFIASRTELLPEGRASGLGERIIIHDACHLRNVLASHTSTHRVLARWYDVLPIPDDGLCCGAGGAYSLLRPDESIAIVERKYDAIRTLDTADVRFVSSGNPGCSGHLASHLPADLNRLEIIHPVQLIARMIGRP